MTSRLWPRIRRIWITAGLLFTAVFVGWSLLAFRATAAAHAALGSDALVVVEETELGWSFRPASRAAGTAPANLLFLPGGMVDPAAYAPVAREVAAAGHTVLLLRLPWRGAFGQADGPDFVETVRGAMDRLPGPWVLAGHSRGGAIASGIAHAGAPRLAGLVLLGTTHPRDVSLAHLHYHVAKVYGTADGIAPAAKVRANAPLLPAGTQWVELAGANHSQFGAYGFQPGDHRAEMDRATQRARIVAVLLEALASAGGTGQ